VSVLRRQLRMEKRTKRRKRNDEKGEEERSEEDKRSGLGDPAVRGASDQWRSRTLSGPTSGDGRDR
jgi:hypothetical protein